LSLFVSMLCNIIENLFYIIGGPLFCLLLVILVGHEILEMILEMLR